MAARFSHRQAGISLIDRLVKRAQAVGQPQHPIDALRRDAQYTHALQSLNQDMGFAGDDLAMDALANNPEYYNRVKGIYDEYFTPKQTASEKTPKVVSVAK